VIYEAAHAIVNMKQTTAKELAPAVSVLQLFCGSSKPTLRFAAVRTLNKVGRMSYTGFYPGLGTRFSVSEYNDSSVYYIVLCLISWTVISTAHSFPHEIFPNTAG